MKLNPIIAVFIVPFLVSTMLQAQVPNYPNLPPGVKEQMAKMQKQSMKNVGIETDESALAIFVKKLKTIKIGEDAPDDVIRKAGAPYQRSNFSGTEQFLYMFMPGGMLNPVICSIQIGTNGKVSCVKVTKTGQHGAEELYVKGTWEMPGTTPSSQKFSAMDEVNRSDHFPLKEVAPENPTEGQVYFNKTDKHFYGYDGTYWLKLDTKP